MFKARRVRACGGSGGGVRRVCSEVTGWAEVGICRDVNLWVSGWVSELWVGGERGTWEGG